MKQAYRLIEMRAGTRDLIDLMNLLIVDYMQKGFTLSVRQLYYQLVARGLIENTERSYKRVASIINDARLCGMMDWDAIEDRNRDIEMRGRWGSGADIVDAAARSFHMDLWSNQDHRVFVIVEKAALAGVLDRACKKYDVPLLAARGYPSVSIVREMALEHVAPAIDTGQDVTILHLGDHDPSGIDMTRDLRERFEMFLGSLRMSNFCLKRIALTMDQIEEKQPPPNPAKTTDSRFEGYRREYGDESWELDALDPSYLVRLVEENIEDLMDPYRLEERQEEVEMIRGHLTRTAVEFRKTGV